MPSPSDRLPTRLLLRPKETGELLGCSRSKVYVLIGAGILPYIRVGGSIRIPLAALQRWIEEQAV